MFLFLIPLTIQGWHPSLKIALYFRLLKHNSLVEDERIALALWVARSVASPLGMRAKTTWTPYPEVFS